MNAYDALTEAAKICNGSMEHGSVLAASILALRDSPAVQDDTGKRLWLCFDVPEEEVIAAIKRASAKSQPAQPPASETGKKDLAQLELAADGGGAKVTEWPGPDDATRARVAKAIDKHPLIASLLYDIDLLPEQIRDARRYGYMLSIISHMRKALKLRVA